jgi:hypothetical protein
MAQPAAGGRSEGRPRLAAHCCAVGGRSDRQGCTAVPHLQVPAKQAYRLGEADVQVSIAALLASLAAAQARLETRHISGCGRRGAKRRSKRAGRRRGGAAGGARRGGSHHGRRRRRRRQARRGCVHRGKHGGSRGGAGVAADQRRRQVMGAYCPRKQAPNRNVGGRGGQRDGRQRRQRGEVQRRHLAAGRFHGCGCGAGAPHGHSARVFCGGSRAQRL